MTTLTFKVPDVIKKKLNMYASEKGLSRSEILRNALLEYFSRDDSIKEGSFFDFSRDIAGSIKGKSDLSVNKNNLKEYGK